MKVEFNEAQLSLPRSSILKLDDSGGVRIACRDGAVWITVDDDPRDFVLEPGESFLGEARRPALVYALEASSIGVSPR